MLYFLYDKTFEGLLSAVFDAYSRKEFPDKLMSEDDTPPLFSETHRVITDETKSKRVWTGLSKKITEEARYMLSAVFLSEQPGMDEILFRYMKKAFDAERSIETNFADPDVLETSKMYRKVSREAERMRMFIRFQKAAEDNLFFAPIEPRYNVIPLIISHFKDRFADQKWIIYDRKRKYGIYYDLHTITEIRFENPNFNALTGQLDTGLMHEDELMFQTYWKGYFKALCIKERLNPSLHVKLLPKRFWKYLPEKK
ncbi:MAG: TIGR03915 family putative DNA repair protein [Candidatus Azobacteroides sp.]|nr:TIGR03915 family putative DNA repair protein [Candidatus Azobacteroides sp.]